MENILVDNDQVYYKIKVNGKLVGTQYTSEFLAEQAKIQLTEEEQGTAAIVPVNSQGLEVLLG
jgi:hypothetical protein